MPTAAAIAIHRMPSPTRRHSFSFPLSQHLRAASGEQHRPYAPTPVRGMSSTSGPAADADAHNLRVDPLFWSDIPIYPTASPPFVAGDPRQ
mmetsp:Transcript_16989/g.36599  ORF Transcript_16989/g.36599 Transcript_16989/m.36599 type:complete len:91 (-) Transcript_16989:306-578(-)|eukprot:CAMPEP_0206505638 /NCGR_PEP_ID=MMETSP0324_2-20121206/56260_1 /ASSEMBLY_ACC=CAM_ASM_000836 /TAXON_ID=2866 /ORGANISM="Crypthecodinium cohnii, Strain Seligo" /LENGTH=90 /DNA_ID=CAMNT_0053995157 /DNA_START=559 /DNA_END=831 /DNA_ORIENTATION=+